MHIIPDVTIESELGLSYNYDFSDTTNISLYIHFPFCVNQCSFCPIKTTKYELKLVSDYIKSLKNEITISMKECNANKVKVESIHFGGGTPSLLKANQLDDILNTISKFVNIDTAEIIFEMNPKFVKSELLAYLSEWKNCTVNLGVQSFDNSVLSSMNRRYNCLDVLRIVELVKEKTNSLGIDYICGWHTADFKTLETDLKYIEFIHPDHISQYPLYTKSNCSFEKYVNHFEDIRKKVALNRACEQCLVGMGYNRYSIFHYENNKIISHMYGRSQLKGKKWIGFGSDAYTYLGYLMRLNSNIHNYINGDFIYKQNRLDSKERFLWELLFFIRNIPVSKDKIIKKFGNIISNPLDIVIQKLQEHGYIYSEIDISLTWNGIVYLNDVERIITDVFRKTF